jgi:DNA-binding NarL/FixJ family response regulator
MLNILIVDSNVLFREGLSNLLQHEPGIQVVAEAGSIDEAVEKANIFQPDLALVDADTPGIDAFSGIRQLRSLQPRMQIVLLSILDSPDLLVRAVRSGARGYLPKNNSLKKFMAAIRAIERGEAVIPRAMIGRLLDELSSTPEPVEQKGAVMLTPRELDVLVELGRGRSNREISECLAIAENTVKVHVHNILEKLDLRNRQQAARYARAQGILSPTHLSMPPANGQSSGLAVRILVEPEEVNRSL